MFGRKRRKARREAAERQAEAERGRGGAHLRRQDDEPSPSDKAAATVAGEPETPAETAGATPDPRPAAAPLRSLLTDGERLGFEPELDIPADQST